MNRSRRRRAALVAVICCFLLAFFGVGFTLTLRSLPNPLPFSGEFFRFDGRAVFAEMAAEPRHSIYGSCVHVWVYRDSDDLIRDVVVTGHAASKVCVRASIQLYEAALDLDPGSVHLLGAGIAHLQGLDNDQVRALQDQPGLKEYRAAVEEYHSLMWSYLMGQLMGVDEEELEELREAIEKLERRIKALEDDELVQQSLRPETLNTLVASLKNIEEQTGLLRVIDLTWSGAEAAREKVERGVRVARDMSGDTVLLNHLWETSQPMGAVLLPFYRLDGEIGPDGRPAVLVLEMPATDLGDVDRVLSAHLEAVVGEVKAEAERRRLFAQARLQEAQERKDYFEQALLRGTVTPDYPITIGFEIDWSTLRVVPLSEPRKVRLGNYIRDVLPGIVSSAQDQLAQVSELLVKLAAATQVGGKLAELNRSVVLDSFLRDWDLAFFDEAQATTYDAWRRERRGHVWRLLDSQMRRAGVNPQVVKQENVVFEVNFVGDRVRLTPYFIAGGDLLLVCDARDGVVRYVDPWALRALVTLPEDGMPKGVQEELRAGRPAEARRLLAAPMIEEALAALSGGDRPKAVDLIQQALIIDPRGTAARLIAEHRQRQRDTGIQFAAAQREHDRAAREIAFLETFEDGVREVVRDRYEEGIAILKRAYDLMPNIPDTLVWTALACLWAGSRAEFDNWIRRAEAVDRAFVRTFLDGAAGGEIVTSSRLKDLQQRAESLGTGDLRRAQLARHIQAGDEHFADGRYIEALWEYIDAANLNTEFSEPYQRIIDVYWELGLYQRALDAAFLQLGDPVFGLVLEKRPLQLCSEGVWFTPLSEVLHDQVESLDVRRDGLVMTIMANAEPVLRLETHDVADADYLGTFFAALDPVRLAQIGDTTAERVLNTQVAALPSERGWAEAVFFDQDLQTMLLKAMVYGGIAPAFVSDSNARGYSLSDRTALLGTRRDQIWETRDVVAGMDYPDNRERLGEVADRLAQYYAAVGRRVVSADVSGESEILRVYEPRSFWSRWELQWARIVGASVLSGPIESIEVPAGLSADLVARLVSGTLGGLQALPHATRAAFLQDPRGLAKLDACLHSGHPMAQVLQVSAQGMQEYLLVTGQGKLLEVTMMSEPLHALRRRLEPLAKDTGLKTSHLMLQLSEEERALVMRELVLPLVNHLSPHVDGDQVVLDGPGEGEFVVVDLPVDPVLRKLILYSLRGNPVVGVSAGSTAADLEVKLEARLDPTRLTLVFSLPRSKVDLFPEPERTNIVRQYQDALASLRELVEAAELGIRVLDLSDLSGDAARQEIARLLSDPDSVVLTFWEALSPETFEVGKDGVFNVADLKPAEGSPFRLEAFAGCQGHAQGVTDAAVAHDGGVSFGFWENISVAEAFRFARQLVELVQEDPAGRPRLIPLLLRINEELELPGLPVVLESRREYALLRLGGQA